MWLPNLTAEQFDSPILESATFTAPSAEYGLAWDRVAPEFIELEARWVLHQVVSLFMCIYL